MAGVVVGNGLGGKSSLHIQSAAGPLSGIGKYKHFKIQRDIYQYHSSDICRQCCRMNGSVFLGAAQEKYGRQAAGHDDVQSHQGDVCANRYPATIAISRKFVQKMERVPYAAHRRPKSE